MGTKTNYWQNVWQERGAKASFLDPIKFDGFDLGPGKLCKKQVEFLAKKIKQSLNLNKNDVILEVGCGAGMTLGPISNFVKLAYGVDFADSLLTRAKGFYPELRLITGEANDLPFRDKMFDKVYSFSVFEYFPSLNYAEKAIKEMIRVLKIDGVIFIGDIPDQSKKKEILEFRAKIKIPEGFWRSSIKERLNHQHYKVKLLKKLFMEKGFTCEFSQQDIPRYGYNSFRFNLVAKIIA